jgi:multidrug efflux system membrane fusion protein
MKLTPYLILVLLTGGLVAFIYKDQLFPTATTEQPGGGSAANAQGGGSGRRGGGFRRGEQIVPVVAEKARTGNVPVYLTGVGTVQAFNTATVRTQVSGRLIDVPYTEGQEVKEGDVLARIDPVLYQAAYDQAVAQKAKDEALLANARLDEKRFANLVKTNAATQQQADTAFWTVHQDEAQVKLDQALIDNAKANLDYATIKAPLTGRTGIRLVDKGNLVSSSDATGIVIITQLRPIAVVFTLPEPTVADVLNAQSLGPVELQAIAGDKVLGEGKLLVVDNQIDQTTGTYRIKGTFPNEQNRLWPGEFVNVKLKLKVLQNVIVIPSVAVQQGPNGSYVYTVTPESTVKVTNVGVVQEGERQAVISSGINAGDTIVTTGFANLQDGTKVKLEPDAAAAQAAGTPSPGAPASDGSSDQQRHSRRGDAAAGEGAGPKGEQRHRRKESQGGEQAGSAIAAPAGQGTKKP